MILNHNIQEIETFVKQCQHMQCLASVQVTMKVLTLSFKGPRRQLSSSMDRSCAVPRTQNTFSERGFAVAGPRVWNGLPAYLRDDDIRCELKTRAHGTYMAGTVNPIPLLKVGWKASIFHPTLYDLISQKCTILHGFVPVFSKISQQ